jgi:beta-lactamase superfamily II metal-dependent hydrolase
VAGQLLVRMYNVGLGDCIYLRVPDGGKQVHILIDCGNKFEELQVLKDCLEDLKTVLPDSDKPSETQDKKKQLDLLVVTHPHEDHFKGIDHDLFKEFDIKQVWLSPAFNILGSDEDAKNYHALQGAAMRGLQELASKNLGEVSQLAMDLLAMSKADTVEMLCKTLPDEYGIQPTFVTADTPEDQLQVFEDPTIKLKVLAPMKTIDKLYLGGKGLVNGEYGTGLSAAEGYEALFRMDEKMDIPQPENISVQDFEQLQKRINTSALALVKLAGSVTNNLSVVLLLEWGGLRLLFPGDAEFKSAYKGQVKEKSCNGSWNVMWEKRGDDLKDVDFLKVGHHGSITATPWVAKDASHTMNKLLDHMLPAPEDDETPTAVAVVSTERTNCWPSIPDPELMEELGKRVNAQSCCVYSETFMDKVGDKKVKVTVTKLQPLRTDMEVGGPEGDSIPYIEFTAAEGGSLVRKIN